MEYWFKPKTYGYGAHPLNWKGWAAVGLVSLLIAAWSLLALCSGLAALQASILLWLGLAVIIAPFAIWAKKKTNGPWRWRWGKRGEKA